MFSGALEVDEEPVRHSLAMMLFREFESDPAIIMRAHQRIRGNLRVLNEEIVAHTEKQPSDLYEIACALKSRMLSSARIVQESAEAVTTGTFDPTGFRPLMTASAASIAVQCYDELRRTYNL